MKDMTRTETYEELFSTRLGGAIAAMDDPQALKEYGFTKASLHEAIETRAIRMHPDSHRPRPTPKPDWTEWKLETDHNHYQRANSSGATVRAVKVTAYWRGERVAAASVPMNPRNRCNGMDVRRAAQKVQRKLAKLGFATASPEADDIAGFGTLNRAAR